MLISCPRADLGQVAVYVPLLILLHHRAGNSIRPSRLLKKGCLDFFQMNFFKGNYKNLRYCFFLFLTSFHMAAFLVGMA